MKKLLFINIISFALLCCSEGDKGANPIKELGTMPAFEKGYEQGVSACYAAFCDEALYIAGGCNFPEIPASDGGAKRYYKGIYRAVADDSLQWEQVGCLPHESAYGVSVQYGNRWYIAGGMNAHSSHSSFYSVNTADACRIDTLPSLPCRIDNAAGAIAGGRLFVVGGNADGRPSNRVFMFDVLEPTSQWIELPPIPSRPRVQPVCAATSNGLFVWSGFSPADTAGSVIVHTAGWKFDFADGKWSELISPMVGDTAIALSGGAAIAIDDSVIVASGGVNREIFTDAVSGAYSLVSKENYMLQPAEWYRFNPNLFLYDTRNAGWSLLSRNKLFSRAGHSLLATDSAIYIIGGELKPGIRTPLIHSYLAK